MQRGYASRHDGGGSLATPIGPAVAVWAVPSREDRRGGSKDTGWRGCHFESIVTSASDLSDRLGEDVHVNGRMHR